MFWRAITEDDLTASLSAAEIDAYRKSAQFGDPVEAQLRSVAAYVRGVIRSSPARVRMAANPLALPESLIVPAMDYLRHGVLTRCNIVVNESRTLAYNKACELFDQVRKGEFVPEGDGEESEDALAPAGSPVAAAACPPRLLD